jgi:hypothetical protein
MISGKAHVIKMYDMGKLRISDRRYPFEEAVEKKKTALTHD